MQPSFEVEMRLNVKVAMRDGVDLSADLYLPRGAGKFPTVLMRTPYSNNMDDAIEKGRALTNKGYACVIQDIRGRWDSDGRYYPFQNDGEDGYDTQEWIGRQEWSDGKIGMAGSSYGGSVQWLSAPHRSRYLTCMAPRVICTEYHRGLIHPGGAFQLNVAMTWGMRTNGRTGLEHRLPRLDRRLPGPAADRDGRACRAGPRLLEGLDRAPWLRRLLEGHRRSGQVGGDRGAGP
jgi:putative CocE/NonD family hydrolase